MENNKQEKVFADGFRFELPKATVKEKAPWIKGHISIKVPEAIIFLKKNQNNGGWVNIDLKKSDNTGNYYLELNTWKPKEKLIDPANGNDLSDNPF